MLITVDFFTNKDKRCLFDEKYCDIRDTVDEYKLHSVDVMRAVYSLTNEEKGFCLCYLLNGVEQQTINELYEMDCHCALTTIKKAVNMGSPLARIEVSTEDGVLYTESYFTDGKNPVLVNIKIGKKVFVPLEASIDSKGDTVYKYKDCKEVSVLIPNRVPFTERFSINMGSYATAWETLYLLVSASKDNEKINSMGVALFKECCSDEFNRVHDGGGTVICVALNDIYNALKDNCPEVIKICLDSGVLDFNAPVLCIAYEIKTASLNFYI